MLKGTVIGGFRLRGKAASGKLTAFKVIADAIAAHPFSGTGIIRARTGLKILFFFALHAILLLSSLILPGYGIEGLRWFPRNPLFEQ